MIENLFNWRSTRARYLDAPLLQEREQYLSHLLEQGTSHKHAQNVSATLLHAVRLLNLAGPRSVSHLEIAQASRCLETNPEFHRDGKVGKDCAYRFATRTSSWLRFSGLLMTIPISPTPFDANFAGFREYLKFARGFVPASLRSYSERVAGFLKWLGDRQDHLDQVSLEDVEDFLCCMRANGWRPSSLKGVCQALRVFFRFCESQGWCGNNLAQGIRSPRIQRGQSAPKGPSWRDVRRLMRSPAASTPADLRTSAIISLCSIYALRSSEVVRLQVTDFDWYNETITVHRSKSRRVQQFPIQYEVGEAILQYLKRGRPHCSCRSLFVTWCSPHRPMDTACVWQIVSKRMKRLNIHLEDVGPHSLRHACATRLLRNGSALRDIADFLGHRGLASVSIYAKSDPRLLRQVASFSLAGIR